MAETKYIFITSGEASALRKGIVASSIAKLLQSCGYSVAVQRWSACLNIDGDTQTDFFVTADGCETDLGLGHYESFVGVETSGFNLVTAGKVYQSVINRERRGDYHGETVRVVPHITDEIKRCVYALSKKERCDFMIVELDSAATKLEAFPFMESLRQLKDELIQECICCHIIDMSCEDEYLSNVEKLQGEVDRLQDLGVYPDALILQVEQELSMDSCNEIAQMCDIKENGVIQLLKNATIYELPLRLQKEGLSNFIQSRVGMAVIKDPNLNEWSNFVMRMEQASECIAIGIVGTNAEEVDAYCLLKEALECATCFHDRKLNVGIVDVSHLHEGNAESLLSMFDGVIIAPDKDKKGFEGKLVAAKWCRENDVPMLGIARGMQCMVVECARNMLGIIEANSTELESRTPYNVIDMMQEQKSRANIWGAMRMGTFSCHLKEGSVVSDAYGNSVIEERHCHSYELNNSYRHALEDKGMKSVGINPETHLVEVVEVEGKTWCVGVQYRPEFNSTVLSPNKLIMDFIRVIKEKKK